ncbi:MAG: pyridoxine 5'-phosphate synthase [Sandaracinus sp.]
MGRTRLHVNVDHVATLRQARGTTYPDPVEAALACELAGADGITVHLREDRRHIQDRDVEVLRRTVKTFLNLEMAATDAMVEIASRVRPDLVTLVPEKREERTTEGGLDVVLNEKHVRKTIEQLAAARVPVSLFIDPEARQIDASVAVGASAIELHTGDFANADGDLARTRELARLARAAVHARAGAPTLRLAAGHGLTARNVGELLRVVPGIEELNVGHAIVSDAVLLGMERAVIRFLERMREAR